MSQKALSICGKRLFDLYGDSQVSRSEFNEPRRSINGSGDEINSQQSLFPGRDRPCEDDNSSSPKQKFALHRYHPFRMAESNTARDSAGDVRVDFPPTSKKILRLTEDLGASKKMMFEICRLPGSNFSSKCDTMGLPSARSNSSNTTSVSYDIQSDDTLHALGMNNSNAVSPIRDSDALYSSVELQNASTHDKLTQSVSGHMQSDILLHHYYNSHHNAVSSIRDSDALHSSEEPQFAWCMPSLHQL
jgi:hypothetical protein